jgi:hypothetical protein
MPPIKADTESIGACVAEKAKRNDPSTQGRAVRRCETSKPVPAYRNRNNGNRPFPPRNLRSSRPIGHNLFQRNV